MSIELDGSRILVTGGAGFIGSFIVDQMLEAGADHVTVVDDFVRGRHENVADAVSTGRVEVVTGDIRDAALVDQLTDGCDLIFHQAALRITQSAEEPVRAIQVMINGTQNILQAAVKHGVKKIAAASTASVYGDPSYLPMDEQHPFNNRTLYGAAKIANEQIMRAYNEMYGLQYVMFRPFNVYGPRMDVFGAYTEVMIRWLERLSRGEQPVIFGDGLQTMDFVYVEDVAEAYVKAMAADVSDEVFNCGTGIETSLRELCILLCHAAGYPDVEPVYAPARVVNNVTRRQACTKRARERVGFEARTMLPEGLRRLARWHSDLLENTAASEPTVSHATPSVRGRPERRLIMTVSAARPVRIPITRPCTGEEEAAAAADVVRSGWLTEGKRVHDFEQALAEYTGARHAIVVSNCTTALHLSLIAAGVGPGDEVICPSFTFIATANAILHAGATPVFVDIEGLTYNTTPELIEAAITPKTRAIMPVDQIGLAADLPAIVDLAHGLGLAVVEDAAPSLGATIDGQQVGSFADFTCFSFHPRKSITTGEGGLITTDDDAAAARLRALRSHGVSTSAFARHASGTTSIEEYREVGWNYRMTDIQAAVGLVQLSKLDWVLSERRRLAARYDRLLGRDARIQVPHVPSGRPHTYQSYCIWPRGGASRADVMAVLAERGIATRRGVMASHLEPFYREMYPDLSLPVTEAASAETLLLPLYVGMTEAEQDEVIEGLLAAL